MAFSDDFDRADSATLGNGWTQLAAAFQIAGNKLFATGANPGFPANIAVAPSSASFVDGTVSVDFVNTGQPFVQVHARLDAANRNGYLAYITNSTLVLARIDNEVLTELSTQAGISSSAGPNYRLTLTLSGNIKTAVLRNLDTDTDIATVNDSADTTYTAPGSTGLSIDKSGTISYDNFTSTGSATPEMTLTDAFTNGSGLLSNESGIVCHVLRTSDSVLAATISGLSTNAAGVLTTSISNAAIVIGTSYRLVFVFADGSEALVRGFTA